jgi:hypothetical protein
MSLFATSWAKRARLLLGVLMVMALTGCASFYVDGNTKEIPAASFHKAEPLHPVQVLFEFQTKGVANARATTALKTRVLDQIKASALFSEVSEQPVSGGASLSVVIDNVPLTDNAFSKGFVTGLTFGLAGSKVSDGYVCSTSYRSSSDAEPIVKKARHAIHTTIGASSEPEHATKAASIDDAVTKMLHQVVSNVLNDMSNDPAFK